ncbi:YceI family protein [Marinactinospora rubrisoli]|uniref:YceI family protein n=1 Tax=Marinactinospora rubrisoli TaxID=2715399 RepID=A0ABW2KHM3_9ACTN
MDSGGGESGRLYVVRDGDPRARTVRIPRADTWYVDPVHSTIGFAAGMQDLVRIRGRFGKVSGVVWIGENPERSTASVTVETASVDTGIERRDNHLRSPDFLDTARFPTMTWQGHRAEPTEDPEVWVFHGDLTLRGVTRPVPLVGRFLGEQPYPFGDAALASFTGSGRLDRFEFGIESFPPLPGMKLFVGRHIEIELDVALINTDIRFFTERFLAGKRSVIDQR